MVEYIKSMEGMTYDKRGRYAAVVAFFLSEVDKPSRKAARQFLSDHTDYCVQYPWAKEALYHYLAFLGIGYRKAKEAKVKVFTHKTSERQEAEVREFLAWLQTEKDYSPNSLRMYHDSLRSFFEYATTLNNETARQFVATLQQQGRKPSTICCRITALEMYAKFRKKNITIKRPKVQKSLDLENVMTEKEYTRLLDYLRYHNHRDYLCCRILATTGARISELMQLTFDDIRDGEVTLRGKGNKYRRFFFTKELQNECKGMSGKILNISPKGFNDNLKRYGDACHIAREKMHPHAFRHFFAKMFIQKTHDVVALADILGHGSVDTTRIYLKKSKDEQQRQYNKAVQW